MNSAAELLDRAAAQYGDAPALEDERETLTYREYRARARAVGTALIREGRRGPALIYMPKSADALCAMLGTLYSGDAYAPADAHAPPARLQKILDSLRPARIIAAPACAPALADLDLHGADVLLFPALTGETDDAAVDARLAAVKGTDPAYIIYTSGSTGTPKGVVIPHEGVLSYADWVADTFGFGPSSVMASQAPIYFDNSVFDIYGALRSGARLELIPEALLLYPTLLPAFLAEKRVTAVFWVPTVMINLANSGELGRVPLPELRTVCFAGEVMPNRQLNAWRRAYPDCVYANLYGPTEITDVCVYYVVDRPFADADPLPIGRPCENMGALILDADGGLCPPGAVGELCIYGTGVALGYWNAPELTARAFTDDPTCPGRRIYRTGDLAHTDADGLIQYDGRRDGQVKVKGNRIELGEVENAARCIPGVENACALFDAPRQEIVLFAQGRDLPPLRKFNRLLRAYIPAYMLPARMAVLEKLPYNANGKIDRTALRNTLTEV